MKVLVVDDDRATALAVAKSVRDLGYEVEVAHDGLTAWRLLEAHEIPIVVTDWAMPLEDGVGLCRMIRSAGLSYYVYVVFLTSHDNRDSVLAMLSAGADDFVSKPFDREEMRARLVVAQRIVSLDEELRGANARLAEQNADLEERTRIDALMGIGNRMAFEQRVDEAHRKALRRGLPYSLVMCDVDHFKRFNDTYGHLAGDEVLRKAAVEIRDANRAEDVPFRYGGEEIVVLLEDQDLFGALSIAERVRSRVAGGRYIIPGAAEPVGITVSCGVASYPESCGEGSHWKAVVECADRAMYAAKQAGRNRVVGPIEAFRARPRLIGSPGGAARSGSSAHR